MKEKQTLQETYNDLLNTWEDSELVQLVEELDTICTAPQPPASLHWAAINNQSVNWTSAPHRHVPVLLWAISSLRRQPMWRKAILVPSVLFLILATSAFAIFFPFLSNLLNFEPSTHKHRNDFTLINQSETIAGTTITLKAEAYADANQIVIGYTISSTKTDVRFGLISFTTRQGIALNQGVSVGTIIPNVGAFTFASFLDASSITGSPRMIALRLSAVTMQGGERTTTSRRGTSPKTLGTVVFNFSVPFHPGKVLTPNLHVMSSGKLATVEKVIVSPSATRMTIQGLGISQSSSLEGGLIAQVQLPGGTGKYDYMMAEFLPDGSVSFLYPYDWSKNPGIWTLTVQTKGHTWTFQFTVPA